MAKRKLNAALFEVIAREGHKGIETPSWAKGETPAGPSVPAGEPPRQSVKLKQPPGFAAADATQPSVSPAPVGSTEPVMTWSEGRLKLSLGYVSTVVASVGLLVLLALAFAIGRSTAPGEAGSGRAMDFGAAQAPRTGSFDVNAVMNAAARRLEAGGEFLVVQKNIAGEADALAIVEYLWRAGYTPYYEAQTDRPGRFVVADTKDLAGLSRQEKQRYAEVIETLGARQDWALRDRYGFRQGEQLDVRSLGSTQ